MISPRKIAISLFLLFLSLQQVSAKCPKCGHEHVDEAKQITELSGSEQGQTYLPRESTGLTDGVYVGLLLGLNQDVGRQAVLIDDIPNHFQTVFWQKKHRTVSPIYGGVFGYLRVFQQTFMAIEIGYTGFTTTVKGSAQKAYNLGVARLATNYHPDYTVSLTQKFGWLIGEKTGVYVKAGPVFGQFTTKLKIDNHPRFGIAHIRVTNDAWVKHKKKVLGLDLGVGLIQQISQDWILTVELSHQRFQKIKYDFEPGGRDTTEITLRPRKSLLTLGLSYKF